MKIGFLVQYFPIVGELAGEGVGGLQKKPSQDLVSAGPGFNLCR